MFPGPEPIKLDQRFYTSQFGRFMSADRFRQAANANDSGSWNKYSYVQNDPVNRFDPTGRDYCDPDDPDEDGCDDPCAPSEQLRGVHADFCSGGAGGSPGGAPPPKSKVLHITNISKSGSNYNAVVVRFNQISAGIDPQCEKFLDSGGGNVQSYISDLLSGDLLAVADFTTGIAAITGTGGTDVPAGTAAIIVNNLSAFFNSNYTVDNGMYTGGTGQAQVEILLHELGHALGATGFQNDYSNPGAGKSNDNLINQNCSKTIQSLGSQ
jgi:RHS repeat-associated protein